jgi:hypothetical protein
MARSHFASSSCWFAVDMAINCEKTSLGNVSVSPDGFMLDGRNWRMSELLIQLGGEEVKFARKFLSQKKVYLMTSTCDGLLCTTTKPGSQLGGKGAWGGD